MAGGAKPTATLRLGALLWAFAALALALTASLALLAANEEGSEWRTLQRRYRELARAAGGGALPVRVRQLYKPALGVVDRCVSCHLGMGEAKPVAGHPVFSAHPPLPHRVRDFGCTVCHGGQGRATRTAAAHGQVRFWDEPLLERAHLQAGCGSCHTHLPTADPALVARGRALVLGAGCLGCHRVGERGSSRAPALTFVGLRGYRAEWHTHHVEQQATAQRGLFKEVPFSPLGDDELAALKAFLTVQVGAPRLIEGKLLSLSLGCRGCHRVGGVGGEEGVPLDGLGRKAARELDYRGVRGPHTLANWLREHFLDPARVVPGSEMPRLGLKPQEAERLTTYMLSLRAVPLPAKWTPKDRARGEQLGERDFPTDGASLYRAFCVACHGPEGRGLARTFGKVTVEFPALANPEFLALADDPFLRGTMARGRPGRRMPAWAKLEGGLRPVELDALVAYVRSLGPGVASFEQVMAETPDPTRGRARFATSCAPCHGAAGEGTAIGPPLAAADNPVTKSENRIYGTLAMGVAGTAMGAFRRFDARELRAVIAAVRELPERAELSRARWKAVAGEPSRGAALFKQHCATCHGERGEGKTGPSIGTPAFLEVARDGYLTGTIVRGREGRRMPGFGQAGKEHKRLLAGEVADLVAFLRARAPAVGSSQRTR
ncbi:MAG: c-type cytochrome [Deltaproteobacteria bacterium]|nr:c-type cytochrome [Deltaproteobacteria bacterium]